MTCTLPVPPSVNQLWRVVRTRRGTQSVILSRQYRAWLDRALLFLRCNMDRAKVYPVRVVVTVRRGDGWRRGRDLDNLLKATLDALKKSHRIEDDSEDYVSECTVRLGPDADDEACVEVSIESVGE